MRSAPARCSASRPACTPAKDAQRRDPARASRPACRCPTCGRTGRRARPRDHDVRQAARLGHRGQQRRADLPAAGRPRDRDRRRPRSGPPCAAGPLARDRAGMRRGLSRRALRRGPERGDRRRRCPAGAALPAGRPVGQPERVARTGRPVADAIDVRERARAAGLGRAVSGARARSGHRSIDACSLYHYRPGSPRPPDRECLSLFWSFSTMVNLLPPRRRRTAGRRRFWRPHRRTGRQDARRDQGSAASWSAASTPACRASPPPTARATGPASTSTSARPSPPRVLERRHEDQVDAAQRLAALRRAAVRRDRHPLAQHHLDADPRRVAGPELHRRDLLRRPGLHGAEEVQGHQRQAVEGRHGLRAVGHHHREEPERLLRRPTA